VAKSGSLLYGWSLLFVFSLGLGLLFLVLGTFAGALQALPRAGAWMETVKKSFGWILLAGALYLGRLLIPEPFYMLSWGVFLIIFAVFAGVFDALTDEAGAGARVWKALMVIVLIVGAISIFKVMVPSTGGPSSVVHQEVEWTVNNEEAAVAQSLREGKPLLVDFYADWCVACVELDEKTYIIPEVIDRTQNMVRLKLDFSKTTPWVAEMKQKYKITGLPTVILYDGTGSELERFTGFKSADKFLALLSKYNL
jgi:thiol:disulfide interchange protein DsbD